MAEVDQLNLNLQVTPTDILLDLLEFLFVPASNQLLLLVLLLLHFEGFMDLVHPAPLLKQTGGGTHRVELNVAGYLVVLHQW